ncbi:hypothetical protein CGZ80_17275 [Rhodopirellula sp. MGV]|nr:hypothetical protein CGZ80_17275 [Rhodopirellula sp. MGV]PNY34122.1 DUF1553 domain-containing protein [Rhodopirellula baltica]
MEFASGRKTDSAPVCFVSDAIRSDAGPPAFPSQSSTSDTEWKKLENWNGKVDESIELLAHRKPDWSRWIAFKVDCDSPQTFVLSYSGGSGSDVFLDNEQVAQTRADELIDDRELLLLSVSAGTHEVMVKLVGDETISRTELSWHSPWAGVSTAGWKHASLENRLWMIADPNGPFNETHFAQTAHSMARAIHRLRKQFTTTLVAKELPTPRNTHILRRGEYDLPIGDPLQPGVLSVLNGFPDAAPRNRLGLAQWMTSPDNPLPSRVLVNRMWQRVFGAALVRTPEDFGVQGEYPTHPDLLDWLAIELQQSGWDFKHMMRLLVTSQTFRQDSTWRDDANDPENRLFARGPAFRLDAEVIRDIGLWASGLLDPTMGGEGIKPYQPEGMWKALAHPASNTRHYEPDQGQRLYRRSIYVYWKRTSPHPMMTLFDAPDRESSCVRRSRTNTALQSLAMLNESQRMDMARALAGRLLSTCDHDEARVQLLFEIVAARPPLKNESDTCMELLDQMRKRYQTDQGAAAALIKVRTDDQPSELNLVETAAWTQVTSVVLASDLAVMLY